MVLILYPLTSTAGAMVKISGDEPPFMSGSTRNCLNVWKRLTTDPGIVDLVSHCLIELAADPAIYSREMHRNFTAVEQQVISEEVARLLERGVTVRSNHAEGECISPIFFVSKPDGLHRLIFN